MAKKKKKEKEEKYEFELPEFDENEFIGEQRRKAKSAFISFSFGILMGIISCYLWVSVKEWGLCFLLGIFGFVILFQLFKIFKIDLSKFGKRDWMGSGAFYFFTWLAIFILSINPPFHDSSPPKIEAVALPTMQELGGSILITAKVTDNFGVDKVKLNITSPSSHFQYSLNKSNDIYSYEYDADETGIFNYTIVARDSNGLEKEWKGNFRYVEDAIHIANYKEFQGKDITPSDGIKIRVNENVKVARVYYTVNSSEEINATYSGIDTDAGEIIYDTSSEMKGWTTGEVEVRVYAEVVHYFLLPKDVEQDYNTSHGLVVDNQVYTFSVKGVGEKESPSIEMPKPPTLERVPGFELLAIIAAIAIVAILKKKK